MSHSGLAALLTLKTQDGGYANMRMGVSHNTHRGREVFFARRKDRRRHGVAWRGPSRLRDETESERRGGEGGRKEGGRKGAIRNLSL